MANPNMLRMNKRIEEILLLVLLLAGAAAVTGCQGLTEAGSAVEPHEFSNPSEPTPTVFTPVELTPTPSVVNVFIDPALPLELQEKALSVTSIGGRVVQISDNSIDAEVIIGLNPERPLSEWVYAVTAPFPTVRDSVTMGSFHQWWRADCSTAAEEDSISQSETEAAEASTGTPAPPMARLCPDDILAVNDETYSLLEAWLGPSGSAVHRCGDDCSLLQTAWEKLWVYSIIPYDELEPRWKVLSMEGVSPLDYSFDPEDYLLSFQFGLSGSAAYDRELIEKLGWPVSNYDPGRRTVVVLTGVTALTRAIAWRMEAEGVTYPAEMIGDWLRQADFTHVSNEVSFTDDCGYPDPDTRELRFCSRPPYFDLLSEIDVDLVELTGNHNLDYGTEPFLDTLDLYAEAGMQWFGGGRTLQESRTPVLISHNGNQIAFFGCNKAGPESTWAREDRPGSNPCDEETYAVISQLDSSGYLTFFTFQWYEHYRSSPDNTQRAGFQRAVDAGAAVVSGSQAHQPMGFEFYNQAFIHYGPGNLFFDQMWSKETREEFVVFYTIYDGRHLSTELRSAMLEDFAQPRPMTMLERQDFLDRMFAASRWENAFTHLAGD